MHSSKHNGTALSGEYRIYGGWQDPPDDLQPGLQQSTIADVVIVGAGFAGLNAAIELAKQGASVAVLEREFAGFGASGRNAGYLAGSMGIEFDLFLRRLGMERATGVVRFYDEAVTFVEQRLDALGIDCDYNSSGIIRAAVHPCQVKRLRKSMSIGRELGSNTEFLDREAMRDRGIPSAFIAGCYQSTGGTLDPGKYVRGLRKAAIDAGVKLYEGTSLESYVAGNKITCKTRRGSITASNLILATNAYSPEIGLLKDKIVPFRVSAMETNPLTSDQLASLNWVGREGIVTPHLVMESYRLTARNTLLITTKRLGYNYGSKTPHEPDEVVYDQLRIALRDRFPQLRDISIQSCWSGYVSMAYDALPVVGTIGENSNIFYSAGCSGHGVASQSLIGAALADRVSGGSNEWFSTLQHKTPRTLPEPVQWIAIKSGLRAASMLDDIVNARARAFQRQ